MRSRHHAAAVAGSLVAAVATGALALGSGAPKQTWPVDPPWTVDSPARVCWTSDDGGHYGSCWTVTVLEDGSGHVRIGRRALALDGGDVRLHSLP